MPGCRGILSDVTRQQLCPCQVADCRRAIPSPRTLPRDPGDVARLGGRHRATRQRRRSMDWRDTLTGFASAKRVRPVPFEIAQLPQFEAYGCPDRNLNYPPRCCHPARLSSGNLLANCSICGPDGNLPQRARFHGIAVLESLSSTTARWNPGRGHRRAKIISSPWTSRSCCTQSRIRSATSPASSAATR
jgi:hypothetical protein